MEDTNSEVRAIQQEMWMTLSEEERFRRCGEMFSLAKYYAWTRAPAGATPDEKREFVFRELYGFDFPERAGKKSGTINNVWLNIVYSGFWDYPFAFATKFNGSTYLFVRGEFDGDLDDYPSEYDVFVRNDLDIAKLERNFQIEENGAPIGRVDMKQIEFDPSHREQIYSRIFEQINNG